jgi:hypothetical protein
MNNPIDPRRTPSEGNPGKGGQQHGGHHDPSRQAGQQSGANHQGGQQQGGGSHQGGQQQTQKPGQGEQKR